MTAAGQQQGKVGILAGGGHLPARLAARLTEQGRAVFIAAFEGHADPDLLAGFNHQWTRLGHAQQTIDLLKQQNVGEVILIGSVGRPSIKELRGDARFMKLILKAGMKAFRDDAALSIITAELEGEGFVVRGVNDYLSDHLAPAGQLGKRSPLAVSSRDIDRGREVLNSLSASDVGQAVVIQEGVVLGIEAIEGTDNLIQRCAALKRAGPGPVLVKLCKQNQSRRVDLPTIGPQTVEYSRQAGFAGIAVQAGGCMLVDRDVLIQRADAAGLFICGIDGMQNDSR